MMFKYEKLLIEHQAKCPSAGFEMLDSGCMARGSDYRVQCTRCGEVLIVGKHPGRREYFNGTDAEFVAGTVLEVK